MTDPTPDPLARLGKAGVLVAFGATWCVPWLLLQEHLDALESGGLPVRRVDVDVWPQHAESFRVVSMPTLVWVHNGAERRRIIGAVGPDALRKFTSRR